MLNVEEKSGAKESPGAKSDRDAGNKKTLSLDKVFWWRRRDLNPGHCGYEPHALAN
jgi:hypothetical protein